MFTGVKNFFENDIVKGTGVFTSGKLSVGIIEYDIESMSFMVFWVDKSIYTPMYVCKDSIKVIGNTFDNPELLRVGA